jgi:hypothetical protein
MNNNKNIITGQQMAPSYIPNKLAQKPLEVRTSISSVPRESANLEAEGGEIAYLPNKQGGTATYRITGPRHVNGGVPLSLPPETFIYSDTKAMKIKDPVLLAEFGMPEKKGGYTPAEIAKKYDVNKYRKILEDPTSDALQVSSAEKMIANFNVKLGKLALIQESMKGFPGGIPTAALPFLAKYNLNPEMFISRDLQPQPNIPQGELDEMQQMQMEQDGVPMAQNGGTLKKFAPGGIVTSQMYNQPDPRIYNDLTPRQKRKMERRAKRKMEKAYYNQMYIDLLTEIISKPEEDNYDSKPDPSTGIFVRKDADGSIYYEDGKGVRFTEFDDVYTGNKTRVNGEVEYSIGNDEKIIVKNGKKYAVKTVTKPAVADKTKVKKKEEATQPGDIYEENGKYYKITNEYDPKVIIRGTQSTGIANYPGGQTQLEADKKRADTILKRLESQGLASQTTKDGIKGWKIQAGARRALTTAEKEFLTDFFSRGNEKGVIGLGKDHPGYNIVGQNPENGFYGYVDPNFYEYRFYKSMNPDATPESWDALTPSQKLAVRKNYLLSLGFDLTDPHIANNIGNPDKLYTADFIEGKKKAKLTKEVTYIDKNTKKPVTASEAGLAVAVEDFFEPEKFRTGMPSDQQLGLEHADAFFFGRKSQELKDEVTEEERLIEDEKKKSPIYKGPEKFAPFWLQDKIRTANAMANYFGIKKYYPSLQNYTPYIPSPVPYNPEQELQATQSSVNQLTDALRATTGSSQALSARASDLQSKEAEIAAQIMGNYNKLNVGTANEFAYKVSDIMNQAQLKNRQAISTYVDQVNTLNQNYDNAKRAAAEEWTNAVIDAYTNKSKAQVLNSLYPNYHIDPSTGGDLDFIQGRDVIANENALVNTQDAEAFAKFLMDYPELRDQASALAAVWTKGRANPSTNPQASAFYNAYSGITPDAMAAISGAAGNYPQYYQEEGGTVPFVYMVGML